MWTLKSRRPFTTKSTKTLEGWIKSSTGSLSSHFTATLGLWTRTERLSCLGSFPTRIGTMKFQTLCYQIWATLWTWVKATMLLWTISLETLLLFWKSKEIRSWWIPSIYWSDKMSPFNKWRNRWESSLKTSLPSTREVSKKNIFNLSSKSCSMLITECSCTTPKTDSTGSTTKHSSQTSISSWLEPSWGWLLGIKLF